jgi:hypothetical protein
VHTINTTSISYDPTKDAANIAKHGVSLAAAAQLDWDTLTAPLDSRRDYSERRIISLRKANPREDKRYFANN